MNMSTITRAVLFLLISLYGSAVANDLQAQSEPSYQYAASVFSDLMKESNITKITPLQGGVSGAGIYKIVSGNLTYVLRILPEGESPRGLKREFEISVRMGELGVSPKVYATSHEKRALVMAAVEGGPIWGDQLNAQEIRDLGQKMRIIHQTHLSDPGRQRTPEVLIKRLPDFKFRLYQKALINHAPDFKELEKNFALTHTDLNPGNLLKGDNNILIIDWTDATLTHPYLDLACAVIFYIHNSNELEMLFSSYTNEKTEEIKKKELNAAYRIYNLILSFRLLHTANKLGATLKKPAPCHMREARDVVKNKKWKKLVSMLTDKDKTSALSRVFLEQSHKDLY